MTDFGHCVRSQFRTPRPQLLAGDALPPCVVGKVLQRIGSAAALSCCPIVPDGAVIMIDPLKLWEVKMVLCC